MAALKKMAAPMPRSSATATRSWSRAARSSCGDIVLLEPATSCPPTVAGRDLNLKSRGEPRVAGESVPVEKNAAVVLDKDIPLGDRKNTAFMEHPDHLSARQGARDRHRHEHANRSDRRDAPVVRGRGHPAPAASSSPPRKGPRNGMPRSFCAHRLHLRPVPGYPSGRSFTAASSTTCRPRRRTSSTCSWLRSAWPLPPCPRACRPS